ncbi:glycosyl hydrolase family 28-related protein, partial [Streptomyces sp. SBT349]|uniref:glycosyl hydrolase family 28-related protein n=1 Tax=Streptomyces sp. SBT349 TaxID=1580539 RepID=UPI00066C182B
MEEPPGRRLLARGTSAALSLLLTAAGTAAALEPGGAAPAQERAASAVSPSAVSPSAVSPSAVSPFDVSPFDVEGRGADVPFVEHEAEDAATNGSPIGPDRVYGTLPSEASGRRAVTLDAVGEYVEFTLTEPANAMTFRYSIPDSAAGTGRDASMDLLVDGSVHQSVEVTSKYGWYYGGYPFNNNPGDTNPHHFYDETRTLFGETLAAGTTVGLRVSSTADSPTFTIDLADFELVAAPVARPEGAIDVVADFGADPTGAGNSTAAIQAAVDAGRAQGREVYLPEGTFNVTEHIVVDQVTLRGAGPWYSVLTGRDPVDRAKAVGVYGKWAADGGSRNVTLRDFAIIGDIRERVDEHQVNAIGGAMSDSVIDNIWMQHTKCGAWMDGPMDNLTIRDSRILDQTADGVNFHIGVTDSTVTNTFVRNTGDDALAMWAERVPNVGNSFTFNTVVLPILANNIVTYGGRDITIADNVVSDTVTNGGGLHVANRYPGVDSGQGTAVSGTIDVTRNTLIRAGNNDFNWQFGVGAIWFSGLNEPIDGATVQVTDSEVLDSSYAAIHVIEGAVNGLRFEDIRIEGAGTYALQIQAPGTASFENVVASGIAQDNPIHNCVGDGFRITQGTGNSGWYTDQPACTGLWPDPQWPGGG